MILGARPKEQGEHDRDVDRRDARGGGDVVGEGREGPNRENRVARRERARRMDRVHEGLTSGQLAFDRGASRSEANEIKEASEGAANSFRGFSFYRPWGS